MLRELWRFVLAVCHHWASLVTGGFLIAALSLFQETGHAVRPWVYWTIALVALFVSFFKAWRDEYRAKIALQGQTSQSQSEWTLLYEEQRRLMDELDSLTLTPSPESVSDAPMGTNPGTVRPMTTAESYESQRKDQRIRNLSHRLRSIEKRIRFLTNHD
jgi:hypothetical protein